MLNTPAALKPAKRPVKSIKSGKPATPSKSAKPSGSSLRGTLVRVLTPEERREDMKAFGNEVRKSKASAVAFLKRAGFIDESGQLAEPYR